MGIREKDKMANGIEASRGLSGTFEQWLTEAKIPEKEVDRNQDGKVDGGEAISYVLSHLAKFSPQVQKEVDAIRQVFRALGFADQEIDQVLTNKDSKKLIEKGEAFEKSASEKKAAGEEEVRKALFENAEKAYRMAADLDSGSAQAYRHLADLEFRQGRSATAQQDAKLAIQLAPAADLNSMLAWLRGVNDPQLKQNAENFLGVALVEAHRYPEARKFYEGLAAQTKDSALAQKYLEKSWWVEEIEHPYQKNLKNGELPFADLALALQASGIPSAALDGRGGPEYQVPDGVLTDRDLILYIGSNYEKNPDLQAVLKEAGIDEGKFFDLYGQTLRAGLKEDLEQLQVAVKNVDLVEMKRLMEKADSRAFDLDWQDPGGTERIENIKVLRTYYKVALFLNGTLGGDADKRSQYQDSLNSLDSQWATLVKDGYPGAEGLDGHGFLKDDQMADATVRTRATLQQYQESHAKKDSDGGDLTHTITTDRETLIFLSEHTEFPLLPLETQNQILSDFSINQFPNPCLNLSDEARVGYAFYLKGDQAEARGNWGVAAGFYAQALEHAPDSEKFGMAAARANLAAGQIQSSDDYVMPQKLFQQAALQIDEVVAKHPDSSEALKLSGEIQMTLGNGEGAQHLFEKALDIEEGKWTQDRNEDKIQSLKDDILKAGKLSAAQLTAFPPQSDDVRLDDQYLKGGIDGIEAWAGMGVYSHVAEHDVSRMHFADASDPANQLQSLLLKNHVGPEQVDPGYTMGSPLPTAAAYQEYAFSHFSQYRKEIQKVYGDLPLDFEGKLDSSIQTKAEDEWKTGAADLKGKLKNAGLQPGSPEFERTFQMELQKPENAGLRSLQILLSPDASPRLRAMAFVQYSASQKTDLASRVARSADLNPKDAEVARRAYESSAESYQQAFGLSQKPKDAKAAAMSYFAAASLARKQGDEPEAKRLFLKGATVLQGLRNLPYPNGLFQDGEAMEWMGHALREAGKYPEALQMYSYAYAAGDQSDLLKEGTAFVNKQEFCLERVDPKFLKRFQELESKEENGKLTKKEEKELTQLRRGMEMLKQVNQDFFPGWSLSARNSIDIANHHEFYPHGIRPLDEPVFISDLWGHMQENELPVVRYLREDILASLKLPPDEKSLSALEGQVTRLGKVEETLHQADLARQEILKKYPTYVQDEVLATGNWSLMKMHYEEKVDNYGQNWEDIPPEWNPAALNKLAIWTSLTDPTTGDPAAAENMQQVMAVFSNPSLVPADTGSLNELEASVAKIQGLVFKTETHLEPNSGNVVAEAVVDPTTGQYLFNSGLERALDIRENISPEDKPSAWIRDRAGAEMKQVATTKGLLKSLDSLKQEVHQTKEELKQAQAQGDTLKVQELQGKLDQLQQKTARLVENSQTVLKEQAKAFNDIQEPYFTASALSGVAMENQGVFFVYQLQDAQNSIQGWDKEIPPFPQDPEQALEELTKRFQTMGGAHAILLKSLVASNEAISKGESAYDYQGFGEYDRLDKAMGFEGSGIDKVDLGQVDLGKVLDGALASVQSSDAELVKDLPKNLHEGIDAQLQMWEKIRNEMHDDYRVGQVEGLIAKYHAAQTALENGDEHKALSLYQLATDSKNLLLAQDAYKEYKKWESIKTLALELAIVAVATVITGGAAAALAPEIMAAEGVGALIVEGTTFTVVDKGIRAGLYYGADVGQNPFKDDQGNWLMPWDYLYEDAKNIAMFGVLKGTGKLFRFGVLADKETKALVEEAFTLSEGRVGGKILSKSEYISKAMDLRNQAKLAQMGFFRKMGFKAGEFATEATTMQLWNNVSASLDVLYQGLAHDRKLDWGQQISQANSEESVLHGVVFLIGTKLSGFVTHPSMEGLSTQKSKEAKQVIQGDLSFQTQLAFQKRATDFQARMVSYDADPQFKYLSEKDREDAKKLIALGDQSYLPEIKKGHDAMDTTFLTEDQKAWLEMRDLLNASVRYSEAKGAPVKDTGAGKDKAPPPPMPASDSATYAALVEGLLPYASDRAPGPATRDAVKDWVQKNVQDQSKYQELLGDLAAKKKVLTVHDGQVTLEDNAKVQIRVQQAAYVYRNMAKKFGLDLKKSGGATVAFLNLAAGDPTFHSDRVEKNLDAVFKNLEPVLKKIPGESQAKVREALFQEAIEGNLSVDRARDLQGLVENGTAILAPGEGGTGYQVLAAVLGTAAPLGSALLTWKDGATALPAAPDSGAVNIKVGGRSLELVTGTTASGDTSFSLRRADGKGEVQILKQGHGQPQALPGPGEPGIALAPGDVLIVDGKAIQYMEPLQVAHETAEREKTIQLGAEIESDRAALAKLPVDSADRKTAETSLANKEAQYRFRLGSSPQSSEDLARLMGVDPASSEGKTLVLAMVDAAKAREGGKRTLHEELYRLGDFLSDWFKIDVDSEAGKLLLKQIATAMTNPELAPALLKRFPDLERLRTELDTATKQVLTRAGLDKVPGRETWRRDLVAFALEKGWSADDLQQLGKVLAQRPELLHNIVDSLDKNSNHPVSGTAKGKQWMGQFLLDAIQTSPDSGSFAATLLNFEAQVRIQGDAVDRIMLLQGQSSLDAKAAIFRQALSEGQKPIDWKNEVQLVANGEVEWRVENGTAVRVEYTLDEATPRKAEIDQRLAQLEPLQPKSKEKADAKPGEEIVTDKGGEVVPLRPTDGKNEGTQVLGKKSKRPASTAADQGDQEAPRTAARNEVGQRTQDTIQGSEDKTIQEPPPADKTAVSGSGGGRTGPSAPGGDSQAPTNPQRPRAGQLLSSDGLDSMTISVDRDKAIRWSSGDRKIPGDPWTVEVVPRGDEKYELVPVEGKAFYKVGEDWVQVPPQDFVLQDGMQLKLGDIEFTWRQPGGETGSVQATNSRQAEEMLAETLFQYYSDPEALTTLRSFAGRSDSWGTEAKAFQEGMAELQIGYNDYSKLKDEYRRDPTLQKRETLNQKWAEVQKNSELLHLSKYHQMETEHVWTIKNLEGKLGTLSNFFSLKEFASLHEGQINPSAPARMRFRLDFKSPEDLGGYEGITKNVSAERMVKGKLEVRDWEEAKSLVAEMGKTQGLEILDPLKIDKKTGSLTVLVDGETRIQIDVSLTQGSEAAQEAHIQEEARVEGDTLRAMEAEIQEMKTRHEDPGKIAELEKILAESKKTYFDSLAQRQLSSDGVPYRDLMPKIVESATLDVFAGKVTPENRGDFRDAILSDLAAKGIRVSTDNAKAIDSMIDIALTAKAHGLIDQAGGITKEQFYALMGDLYLHNNPVVRIGAAELTHVPMVVQGSLDHYEGMAQARGEKVSTAEKKAVFLAALLHDAGKWDPNIRTQTGYTILKTSPFNKTGADIVVKPGQSLKEALAEQKLDPAQVTLPFDGMTAILVHHDAKTVRSSVKRLVELGILEPVEAQRVWEAIQYHGFVSSWIVVNSLSGMGIKSHVFNASYDKQLKPYLDAFQKVSKRMGEAGIPDLPTLMKDPAFAGDVAKMRAAFEKLPHYVQALMLGDHQGQIDIAKYMGILSMPAKDASIYDLFFGDSMTNSVLGVLRTHSYEQTLLSPDQGQASASAFTAAESWLKQSDPQQAGLAKAILADKDLAAKYEQWRAGEGKGGSVQDWLKTLKVKADGKNSAAFTKIQGLVEKSFYDFYTKDPSKPLDWRSAQEAEQNYQALPAKTRKLIDLFSAPYEVDGNWIHADTKPIVDLIDAIGPQKIESVLEHGDISSQNLSRLLDIATNENYPDKAALARDFLQHASAEEIALLTDSQAMMIDRIVNFKFKMEGKTLSGLDFLAMENPYPALQGIIGHSGNPEMERRLLGALALREFHADTHTQEGLEFLAMFGIDPKTHDHFPWNVQDTLSRADLYVEVEQSRRQMVADYQRVFPNLPKETIDGFVKDLWKTLRTQDVQDTHLPYTPHGWKHSLAVMEDSAKIFDQAGPVRDTIIAQLRPKYGDRAEAVARELVQFIGIFHDTGYGCLHAHEHKGLHAERSGELFKKEFTEHMEKVFGIKADEPLFNEVFLAIERHGADKPGKAEYMRASDKENPFLFVIRMADNLDLTNRRMRQIQLNHPVMDALKEMYLRGESADFKALGDDAKKKEIQAIRDKNGNLFDQAVKDGRMSRGEAERNKKVLAQLNESTYPHFAGTEQVTGYRLIEDPTNHQMTVEIELSGWAKGQEVSDAGYLVDHPLYQVLRTYIAAQSMTYGTGPDGRGLPIEFRYRETFRATTPDGHDLPLLPDNVIEFKPAKKGEVKKPTVVKQEGIGLQNVTAEGPSFETPKKLREMEIEGVNVTVYQVEVTVGGKKKSVEVRLDASLTRQTFKSAEKNLENAYSKISLDRDYDLPNGDKLRFTGDILGQGSTGTVFLAEQTSSDGTRRKVSIKVYTHSQSDSKSLSEQIQKEAKAGKALGEFDPNYARSEILDLGEGRQAFVGPYFTPDTSTFFNNFYNLPEDKQKLARPQLEKLLSNLADRGFRLGDMEFVLDAQGNVSLIDLGGVRPSEFRPADVAAKEKLLEDLYMAAGLPKPGTPESEPLPAAAAGGPDVPQRLADDEGKSTKMPNISGVLDTGSQSLPGAMIVPHQPGASGYPFTDYRKLTVDAVDADKGVITLSQEGNREKLRLEFDPKNPPPSLSDFIPGMEVDVLHGGGGTAFPNRGRFQSIQTNDLQYLQSLPKLPIAEGILNGGDPKVQLTSKVEVGGYTFFMTDVIHVHTSKESREYVLALVAVPQADGSLRLERRTFTKSNSGTGWVAMSATLAGGRHFKGGGSYTVEIQLAPEVVDHLVEKENRDQQRTQQQQVTMTVDEINQNYTNAGNRYTYENPQSPDWQKGRRIGDLAAEDVTNFAHSVTLDRPSELESLWKLQPGKVLRGARDADDEAMAKGIPGWQWNDVVPGSLSELQHYLDHIQYPQGFIPDFTQQPLKTYQRHQSVLGDFTCYEFGGAKLGGRDLVWTMALDSQGRTWVQSVRYADAKPNSYGVYSEALDIGILASKPLEYDHQAEVLRRDDREHRYFRPTKSRYVDITPMLGQLEPMRRFKQAMGVSEPIYDNAPLKSPLELKLPAGKDRVVIGRNPQVSDVVLHDAQTSKAHAVAQKGADGDWYLMDGYVDAQGQHHASSNGVKSRQLVENRDGSKEWQWVPVGRESWYRLTPGEYLKFGETQMVFHPPVEAAPQADPTKASGGATNRPNVEVVLQAPPGKKSFTVGRNGAAVDMSFNDAGMSRVHGTFYGTDDGKWWLLDGGFDSSGRQVPSRNGISTLAADGQEYRLPTEGWVEVQPGQPLKMGDHWFTFQASESASPRAPDARDFQAVETAQGPTATPIMDWAGFSDQLEKNEIAISQLASNVEELNLFVGDTSKIDPKADLSVVVDDGATRGEPTFWGKLRREGDHWIYYPAERVDAQGVQDGFYQPKVPRPDGWIELSEGDRLSIGFADFRIEGGKLVQAEDLSNLSVNMALHNPDEVLGAARGAVADYVEPVFSQPNYDPQAEILSGNIDLNGLIPITVHPAEEGRGEIAMATTQGKGYSKSNEDVVMTVRGPKGETILLDIDGMGGHGNGDKAALLIAEAFAAEIPRSGDNGKAWQLANTAVRRFNGVLSEGKNVSEAMQTARALIADPASQIDGKMARGAGAVAVQMTLDPPQEPGALQMAHFQWAGDGRAMALSRDPKGNWRWFYRTVDEGYPSTPGVLEPGRDYQVGGGRRTLAMAVHPQANVVVNSVGGDYLQTRGTEHGEIPSQRDPRGATEAGPDLAGGVELQQGDLVLLGSDGFWENFGSTKVIEELLRPAKTAEEATKILSDETHWRMDVLGQAKAGTLPEVIPGLYRIDRPEGIVYTDLQGRVQRAKTLYLNEWGQVFDSPNATAPVDHYKNDNFSLMTYLHNPVEPPAPS